MNQKKLRLDGADERLQGQLSWVLEGLNTANIQGYLAHEKTPPPRTLQQAHAQGPVLVLLVGDVFL